MDMKQWTDQNTDLDPEIALACAILELAAEDWRHVGCMRQPPKRLATMHRQRRGACWYLARDVGAETPRQELIRFWAGPWAELLCEAVGVNKEGLCQKLWIPT